MIESFKWRTFIAISSGFLRDNGYEFKRQGRGDHEIWWNEQTGVRVTVDKQLKARNTANAILKDAGLRKAF